MTSSEIVDRRLRNQHLSSPALTKPADVVRHLGAVQAQEYQGAKWALGQRMRRATDDAVEKACAEGSILRTHVMRPTWHFVAPEDIRWMLRLTAPRVNAAISFYYRKLGLDDAIFRRSNKVLASALRGGRQLTRAALRQAVQQAGLATHGRFIFMLIRAELDAVICSGARSGKQCTYALLDDRVSRTNVLTRDDALAELARRYFTSHGPATLQDFVWWSGLTTADARAGLDMVRPGLVQDVIEGKTYWLPSSMASARRSSRRAYLLPTYDEYLVAYQDRSAAIDATHHEHAGGSLIGSPVVLDGRVVGSWKRTLTKHAVAITVSPFAAFGKADREAVADAAERYGDFFGLRVVLA